MFANSSFVGVALGSGPVRVLLADAGDVLRGRVDVGMRSSPGWIGLQTVWFAMPGYNGAFVVRAKRLGASSPIEVRPGGTGYRIGLSPGSGPLVVAANAGVYGPQGYRTMPGSTWIRSPGCYAWQVDGRGFSQIIVMDAVASAR